MPRFLLLLRWLAVFGPAVAAQAASADPGGVLHSPRADCVTCPAPCPTAPCPAPPTCSVAAPSPRVVVHVPPPEVVFEGGCRDNVFRPRGLFRKPCGGCGHCSHCGREAQPQTQSVLVPLAASVTSFGSLGQLGGLSLGATNLSAGGVQLMQAAPAAAGVQVVRQVVEAPPVEQRVQVIRQVAEAPPVERVQVIRQMVEREDGVVRSSAEFTGLRAIHDAEIRAASILAARAQQDAELRATLSALDRARGSVSATLASADCQETTPSMAATTATVTHKMSLALESIEKRLTLLETDVRAIKSAQGGGQSTPSSAIKK